MGSANNANRGLMNPAPGAEAMSKFRASGMYKVAVVAIFLILG